MSPGDKPCMAGLSSQVEQKKSGRRLLNHHIQVLYRHEKSSVYLSSSDELEVYLSLYSPRTNSYVSERALVSSLRRRNSGIDRETPTGGAVRPPDMVFVDVGTLDQCRELHLVCHVFRIGKMIPGTMGSSNGTGFITYDGRRSSSHLGTTFKRPFAVGVMNINKLVARP